MCCTTIQRILPRELYYVPQPTFIIPILRAPTTTSTAKTITNTTTSKIITAILKHEQRQDEISTTSSNMISQHIFENLILTNTIVAAFCIILMITLTIFLIFLLIPSIRRRWLNENQIEKEKEKEKEDKKFEEISTLPRQASFPQFTLGPPRLNPLFESPAGATTTTTQFGPLFHPHTTTATLLHPALWTPLTQTSLLSTSLPIQQTQISSTTAQPPTSAPSASSTMATTKSTPPSTTTAATTFGSSRPPLPTHPPTSIQRSPRKR